MDTIALWEQEIEENENKEKQLREDTIYNFYGDVEPIQEGFILTTLTAIGLYITATILIIASILVINQKEMKFAKEDIEKNPKSKALIEKAIANLQEFIYKNLPSEYRKYFVKAKDISINMYNKKTDGTISYCVLDADMDKLVRDKVEGNYKSVKDLVTDDYVSEEDKQAALDDPDFYLNIDDDKKKFAKYIKFVNDMDQFTEELNKKVKTIPNKYGANIVLRFDSMSRSIQYNVCPYFRVQFKIPSKSISSFNEDELKEIEKVAKIKL